MSALRAGAIVAAGCAAALSIDLAAAADDGAIAVLQAAQNLCPHAILDPATLPTGLDDTL